jgi:hypothetical protein
MQVASRVPAYRGAVEKVLQGKGANWYDVPVYVGRTSIATIIELVDSISRDGPNTPIYVIHYKHPNISGQVTLCEISNCENHNIQQII